jgi:hypothetical protein
MRVRPTHPVPSAEARARALAAVTQIPSPTRGEHRTRALALAVGAVIGTAALFFAMGGLRMGARPSELVAFTCGLGLAVASAATFAGLSRRRSMLGRPSHELLVVCFALAPLLTVVALSAAALWPLDEDVSPNAHLACLAFTVIQGALPLAALFVFRRGTDPLHPALTGTVLGTVAGAWSSVMAYLRCPHASVTHWLVAHVLPVVVLAVVGLVLGRTLLKIR